MLTVLMLLTLVPSGVSAIEIEKNDVTLKYNLTSRDKNVITVQQNEEITIKYTLENASADAAYKVISATNEIFFDNEFFEYVGDIDKSDCISSASLIEKSKKDHRVYFNGAFVDGKTHSAKQYMGSFVLKVKAASGESVIRNTGMTAFDTEGRMYKTNPIDLTVVIGDENTTMYSVIYKNGDEICGNQKVSGKTKVIAAPIGESGDKFLGWKSSADNMVYQPGDEVEINADTTFTAQWQKALTKYSIKFETNGGTEIEDKYYNENTSIKVSDFVTERDGYRFDGWYTDSELTTPVGETLIMDSDKVLYAKWTKKSSGGGGGGSSRPGAPKDDKKDDKEDENKNNRPSILISDHIAYIIGSDGGYVYPENNITRAEAATVFFRLLTDDVREENLTKENSFMDSNEGDWFNTAVSTLAKMGIVNGREEGAFEPDENITRAEFTTIAARLSEAKYEGEDFFPDIKGHWASEYINIAASIGWVEGDNGIFRPDDNITRAEVMTLVNRVLGRQPQSKSDLREGMITPPDNTNENNWYYLAVQEATNSHKYELKSDGTHEKWTELVKNTDWTEMEK